MRRPAILALVLLAQALPAMADGLRDAPRALGMFDLLTEYGYADLSDDRHGPPSRPAANEMGLMMVSRMFRLVCLGIERGEPLETLIPPGFTPVPSMVHYWGEEDAPDRPDSKTVLSPTGFIDTDEDGGHPWITLSPSTLGMTCRIDWTTEDEIDAARMEAMAWMLTGWFPWEYALIDADRPTPLMDPALSHVINWDRPCGTRWCGMTALYSLGSGNVMLKTTLNITGVEGERP